MSKLDLYHRAVLEEALQRVEWVLAAHRKEHPKPEFEIDGPDTLEASRMEGVIGQLKLLILEK